MDKIIHKKEQPIMGCTKCGKVESMMTASPTIKKDEQVLCVSCREKGMKKEQAKRIMELLIIGILGLKDSSEQTFKDHLQKVLDEINNLIDELEV